MENRGWWYSDECVSEVSVEKTKRKIGTNEGIILN